MNNPQQIAAAVLAKAIILDARIKPPTRETVLAWGEAFEDQGVYMQEALDAVRDHYRVKGAWPIMPGDVIASCKTRPMTSSPDATNAFLDKWAHYPYSRAIQNATGMNWDPPFPVPADIEGDALAERDWHRRLFREWIEMNRHLLQQAILTHNPRRSLEG